MTQATQSRRKGSVSEKDASSTSSASAAPGRSQTPSRQLPDKKNAPSSSSSSSGNNSSANALKGKMSSARSTSTPKQRGKSSSSAGSSTASLPSPPSRFELALAKMQKETEGKSDEQLQMLLQQLLQNARFEDAAYLISASAFLNSRFKTSDVVRLMLEAKQFEQTAQLIRDMKLQSNQLLVTLFVKELVRCSQFHAAVRYAQEMVQNFGKKDFGPRDQERPSWTPQALIQAMLRAFQFKAALKFSKQFDLLDTFPALPLVANMFEARQWEDAISSVMEYRLFSDFPIEALIMKMLGERQWTLAVKCMGKVQAKELFDKYADALVREAARAGDFVIAVRYLNEYKLDQPEHKLLMQHVVDCMITYSEMYKAIKYSIKFGLANTENTEGGDAAVSRYDTKKLIRKAIEMGQFHVATLYIRKLRLKDEFVAELAEMEQRQQARLREFREFVGFRESQFSHPATQHQLYTLIGDKAASDADLVELDLVTVDVVLSEVEEIIPRKKKREVVESEQKVEETGAGGTASLVFETITTTITSSGDASLQSTERQSRFNFARTSAPGLQPPPSRAAHTTAPSSDSIPQERAHAPPPGLAQFAQPAAVRTDESSSSFNFAQFASALQGNAAPASSPTHIPALSPTPQQMQQNLQQQAAMYAQHAPMMNGNFSRGPVPPPPSFVPSFHQGNFMQNMNPNQAPLPSYMMPPPPPAQPQQNLSRGMNPSMDIASLAMQFHSSGFGGGGMGRGPGFVMNGGAPAGNYPPQMPPQTSAGGAPPALNHLFPSFAPPPPPPQFAPPPRSSFKPSIGYTSVTTTRQKK